MRAFITISSAPLLLVACQNHRTQVPDYNVIVNLHAPDDQLYYEVDSALVSIEAPDMPDPVTTGVTIEGKTTSPISFGFTLDEGTEGIFDAKLLSNDSRTLFTTSQIADVPSDWLLVLEMRFHQTGFGAGSTVKVFRDELPWESAALDSVLSAAGLTLGQSTGQYQVYQSAAMTETDLNPGIDLVIISNDQPQPFYDNYAANQNRFDDFVLDGGTILWCACDMGWNYGSIADAGLTLPGAVDVSYSLDQINIITDSDYALLGGLADTLHGNYASQEYFGNLPYGAITYLTDTDGHATMIAYEVGDGWVILSGQPLEYNYDRKDLYNMGYMLPALIRFLLGITGDGIFSYIPGSGAFEQAGLYRQLSSSPVMEGAPRQ
jgi:hypothetical protein